MATRPPCSKLAGKPAACIMAALTSRKYFALQQVAASYRVGAGDVVQHIYGAGRLVDTVGDSQSALQYFLTQGPECRRLPPYPFDH